MWALGLRLLVRFRSARWCRSGDSASPSRCPQLFAQHTFAFIPVIVVAGAASVAVPFFAISQQTRPSVHRQESPAQDDSSVRQEFVHFDLLVTPTLLEQVSEYLVLSDAQLVICTDLFTAYQARVRAIEQEVGGQVEAAGAGAQTLSDLQRAAWDAGETPPWEEISRLIRVRSNLGVIARREADQALDSFYADMQAILTAEQAALFWRVPVLVRRWNFFEGTSGGQFGDFNVWLDLFELVEAASTTDAELTFLKSDSAPQAPPVDVASARQEIHEALEDYELAADRLLLKSIAQNRRLLPKDYSVLSTPEDDNWAARQKKKSLRWRRNYPIQKNAVLRIAAAVDAVGGRTAREAWLQRFNARFCPSLYRERLPDRLIDDLLSTESSLDDEQRALLRAEYERYVVAREIARRWAVVSGTVAKRDNPANPPPLVNAELHYAEDRLRLRTLVRRCLDRWQTLVPNYKKQIRAAVLAALRQNPELLGPTVGQNSLRLLEKEDPFEHFD